MCKLRNLEKMDDRNLLVYRNAVQSRMLEFIVRLISYFDEMNWICIMLLKVS
jgi:hypothetical protein